MLAVKMDVQGFEGAVLDGGTETIERARVLESELLVVPSYEGEALAPELLNRIFAGGFRIALVDNVVRDQDVCAIAIDALFVRD